MLLRWLSLLLLVGMLVTGFLRSSSALFATTWYARADGGTTTQCTGKTNAAYPGTGTGQPCAYANPQDAINIASLGDTINLRAGDTFTGNFTLPAKSGSTDLTIQSTGVASLPAGSRVSPAQATFMAKLQSTNVDPAIATAVGAHNYKLIGIELTITIAGGFNVVRLGEFNETNLSLVPHHLTLDRCYVHGQPTLNIQRGVLLNSAETSVTNSYLSDIHWVGVEAQAIGGWNGPGPFTITNNYIEAAGINILFGGAQAAISGLIPSNITITGNYLFKPLKWRIGDPAYAGIAWTEKNLFELKNAHNVTFSNNICENAWPHSQIGWAVIFNSFADQGESVTDVTMTRNTFLNTTYGIDLRGADAPDTTVRLKRITIEDNYLQNLGAYAVEGSAPAAFLLLNASEDVTINHNTVSGTVNQAMGFSGGSQANLRFKFTNQLMPFGNYGVFGDGGTFGTAALNQYTLNYTFLKNALYAIVDQSPSQYPADNYFPPTLQDSVNLLGTDGLPVGVRGTTPTPTPTPTVTPTPTFSITGTITLDGSGLPAVDVQLLRSSDRVLLSQSTTGSSGAYSLSANAGTSVIVSPVKTGYTFVPSEVLYSTIGSNQNQNFTAAAPTPTPTPTPPPPTPTPTPAPPTPTPTPTPPPPSPTPTPTPGTLPTCGPNQVIGSPPNCNCAPIPPRKVIGNPRRCKP